MTQYIALLRGVNVGGKNIISMKVLKEAFEKEGLNKVITYINSGNILFESELDTKRAKELCQDIIKSTFNLEITVGVIKGKDLLVALENAPKFWNNGKESKHNMIFVIHPATTEEIFQLVGKSKPEYESIAFYDNVMFWSAPLKTFSKTRWSKVSTNKKAYKSITIRNANTTLKLAELVKERM